MGHTCRLHAGAQTGARCGLKYPPDGVIILEFGTIFVSSGFPRRGCDMQHTPGDKVMV